MPGRGVPWYSAARTARVVGRARRSDTLGCGARRGTDEPSGNTRGAGARRARGNAVSGVPACSAAYDRRAEVLVQRGASREALGTRPGRPRRRLHGGWHLRYRRRGYDRMRARARLGARHGRRLWPRLRCRILRGRRGGDRLPHLGRPRCRLGGTGFHLEACIALAAGGDRDPVGAHPCHLKERLHAAHGERPHNDQRHEPAEPAEA